MPDLDPEVRDRAAREAVNIDIPDEVWDAAAEVLVDPIAPSQFKAIVQATTRAALVMAKYDRRGEAEARLRELVVELDEESAIARLLEMRSRVRAAVLEDALYDRLATAVEEKSGDA